MQSDYHIEDLVYQTGDVVVYRARNKKGIPHAVNRIKFPYEILSGLEDGRFEKSYDALLQFKHPCVRTVVDGGQDPVDSYPWVATKWWNGVVLNNKIKEASLSEEELQRIRTNGESLIEKFGDQAAAFAFTPQSVIVARDADGNPIDTFAIDYFAWFRNWSLELPPGGNRDPERELDKLIEVLKARQSPLSSSTPQSLSPPKPAKAPDKPTIAAPATPTARISTSAHAPLASNSSGGGLKAVLVITLLLGLVGGGLWWIKKQPPKADPQTDTPTERPPVSQKAPGQSPPPVATTPKSPTSPAKTTMAPQEEPKVIEIPDPTPPPVPPKPVPLEPRRPSLGEIPQVDPTKLIALERFVGQWVSLKGEVDRMEGKQIIHLKNTSLKATLKLGNVTLKSGEKVGLVGILKSQTQLEVPDNTDIEIFEEETTPPVKSVYGVEDEAQLRAMTGQRVTVSAEVLGFKTSNSGKTFYLLLNDTKPEFAFSISANFANTEELNQEYLESLVGKTVKVTGPLKVDDIGRRLNIYFKYKSNLEVAEE